MMVTMPRYARLEREALAEALLDAGPDAPTLCEGWTARDLAAHVALRDRRPDAAVGIMVKPLAGYTERLRRGYRDGHPYPELVDLVRHAPRLSLLSLPALDEAANTIEFFIHTEDVRRGRPDWQPRPLDAGLAGYLWRRLPWLTRLNLRRVDLPIRVEAPGHGAFTVGNGEPAATVSGDPGELVLFFYGRQRAARVDISGPDDLTDTLRGARFGV
jgi:uncharacterized protein (TIGR03085 family)